MPVTSAKTAGAISSAVASVNLRIDTGAMVNDLGVPVPFVGSLTDAVLTVPQMTRLTWHIVRAGGVTGVQIQPIVAYRRITNPGKFPLDFVPILAPVAMPAGSPAVITVNTVAVEAMSVTLTPDGQDPDPDNRFIIYLSASA